MRVKGKFNDKRSQKSLKNLILRFACPGATIRVWYLYRPDDFTKHIFELKKAENSAFQFPGSEAVDSDFHIGPRLSYKYSDKELDDDWLPNWPSLLKKV